MKWSQSEKKFSSQKFTFGHFSKNLSSKLIWVSGPFSRSRLNQIYYFRSEQLKNATAIIRVAVEILKPNFVVAVEFLKRHFGVAVEFLKRHLVWL